MAQYPDEPWIPDHAAKNNWAGWLTGGHYVIFQAWRGWPSVVALLQEHGAHSTGTGAEWEVIDRPRNVGITEWRGRNNKTLELAVIIEGWVTRARGGLWIEDHVNVLEQMADEPLTLRVIGPIPHWGRQWVITHIDYGEYIRDVVTGRRMRQFLTVHLLEYIEVNDLAKLPRAGAEPKSTREYVVTEGDDLRVIAQKTLGVATRWADVAAVNDGMRGIALNARRYPPGTTILVPKL